MKIEHNSRLKLFRTPFGAVPAGTPVRLRLGIADGGLPRAVKVQYKTKTKTAEQHLYYVFEAGGFCYYETTLMMPEEPCLLRYYFDVDMEEGHVFYGNAPDGCGGVGAAHTEVPKQLYQITVYDPAYKTPEWFRNAVVYQIFPDRFSRGEDNAFLGDREDIIRREWNETPFYKAEQFGGTYLANDFFGGSLRGIREKLPYLKDLGIDAIYLNPIFKAYSNHKYDTGDYMEIDPMFGTETDFVELANDAKKLGIRLILDGVFNHTGSDSRYFNKDGTYDSVGAYQSKDSTYFDWYKFDAWPNKYEAWWGMLTLPHVNEDCKSYQEFILTGDDAVVKHWLRLGASGWRLDVVDELPDEFVKILRKEVKKQDPDAVVIGEVWEDASNKVSYSEEREYLLGHELDSAMNYPLRDAIVDFAKGNLDAENFDRQVLKLKEHYPKPAFYAMLNLLSSHDVARILTAVSNAPEHLSKDQKALYRIPETEYPVAEKKVKAAVLLQMLLPGVPCVYYGDEIGMEGFRDPFCRGTFCWDQVQHPMHGWYKTLIALRKSSKAFVEGAYETVYKFGGAYAFIRTFDAERYVAAVNFSETAQWVRLDVARYGVTELRGCLDGNVYRAEDGVFYVELEPYGTAVLCAM